jgi:hypothetical protein
LEIVGRDSAQINGLDVEELGMPTLNEDFQSTSAPTQRSTQERATPIPGGRTPLKVILGCWITRNRKFKTKDSKWNT